MGKTTLVNIGWERAVCHLCQNQIPPQPILVGGKPLVDGQYGYSVHPVICDCGLVYLDPRWSKEDYTVFYTHYYDDLYRLETKPDYGVAGVLKNMETIWRRIAGELESRQIATILDVGSGFGHGLHLLQQRIPGSRIFAIESSPECCIRLVSEEIGATLVSKDFDSEWSADYQESMDLIILRHTVEHMLDPVSGLASLRSVLSERGLIYIATPDNLHPRTSLRDYRNWWEYWFRAVHPYYFCLETLVRTMELAGLYPVVWGEKENEEIWVLAGRQPVVKLEWERNLKGRQLQILNSLLP